MKRHAIMSNGATLAGVEHPQSQQWQMRDANFYSTANQHAVVGSSRLSCRQLKRAPKASSISVRRLPVVKKYAYPSAIKPMKTSATSGL
jgi:hypothetical protein